MANKPVIAIDIDDTQFKSFYELFNKYKSEVGDMPEAWKGANDVLNAGMAAVVEQTHNINKNIHAAITAQNQFAKATHVSNKGMKTMAKYAKETYEHIFNMGKFVLKAGAWGGGLLAAGAFGFDKLAGSVLKSAVSARSINTDTGRLRAFQTDYAQLAPANLPNAVYGAQRDMSKWGWLGMATGLSPMQASQADPVALSQALVRRAHDYYQKNKNNPAMLSEQSAQMQAFSAMGMDREAVTLAGNTPERKIIEAQRQMQADAQRLRYTSAAIDEMQKFWRALRIAGQNLETILGNRLSKLAGPIGKLITAVEDDAGKLLNGLLSKQNLDAAKNALDSFTKFLESGDAKADVKKLVDSTKDIAGAISDAAAWINHVINPKANPKDSPVSIFNRRVQEAEAVKDNPRLLWQTKGDYSNAAARKVYEDLDKKNGLAPGTTFATIQAESNFNPFAVSKAGAMGMMQLMPATAKMFGVENPFDPAENIRAGSRDLGNLKKLQRRLHPGLTDLEYQEMTSAAYNWGEGNFEKFWKREQKRHRTNYIKDWVADLPKETQGYIAKIVNGLPKSASEPMYQQYAKAAGDRSDRYLSTIARNTAKPVHVTISTTTPVGARVAMQANAAR